MEARRSNHQCAVRQKSDKSDEKLIDSELCVVMDLLNLANVSPPTPTPIGKPGSCVKSGPSSGGGYFSSMRGVETSPWMTRCRWLSA